MIEDPERAARTSAAPDIPAPLRGVIAELESLDRPRRMEALLAWADQYEPVPPEVARLPFPEENRAPHCESDAYVFAKDRADGTLDFYVGVESPHALSARVWAAILVRTCSGQPLEQVAQLSEEAIYGVFGRDLSMGKEQGLLGISELVTHAARSRLARRARKG